VFLSQSAQAQHLRKGSDITRTYGEQGTLKASNELRQSASAIKTSGSTKRAASAHFNDSEEAPANKGTTYAQSAAPAETDEEEERPFIGYHADYGPAAKPAQLQHLSHRTSTQNVRYVTIGTRPGEASRHRRQRFKHLRAFSSLRSSHHDLELMPNLHPGTEHAVSIQGTGNWWPKESQQEPWHTETTTEGGILRHNGITVNWFADIIKQ
jgi:hypothetical protein